MYTHVQTPPIDTRPSPPHAPQSYTRRYHTPTHTHVAPARHTHRHHPLTRTHPSTHPPTYTRAYRHHLLIHTPPHTPPHAVSVHILLPQHTHAPWTHVSHTATQSHTHHTHHTHHTYTPHVLYVHHRHTHHTETPQHIPHSHAVCVYTTHIHTAPHTPTPTHTHTLPVSCWVLGQVVDLFYFTHPTEQVAGPLICLFKPFFFPFLRIKKLNSSEDNWKMGESIGNPTTTSLLTRDYGCRKHRQLTQRRCFSCPRPQA